MSRGRGGCVICSDPRRGEIDQYIVQGKALSEIARSFGKAESSVRRHREHVAEAVALARLDYGRTLDTQIQELDGIALRIQEEGKAANDYKKELAALDRRIRLLELAARSVGDVKGQHLTNVLNVTVDAKTAKRMAETFLARQRLLKGEN